MHTISQWWMWTAFFLFIIAIIVFDIFLLNKKETANVSNKKALSWVIIWILLSLLFNLLLWFYLFKTIGLNVANKKALEFFTGYLIEKSLSVDNIFVFVMIFSYFSIPFNQQRSVLLYGVLGAIFMRLIMILLGVMLVAKFSWILYLFGSFLVFASIKMLITSAKPVNLSDYFFYRFLVRHLRMTKELYHGKFFIRKNNLIYFTPLFLVLILIELSDLIFAVDSVPAIFAITNDPFIIVTSNIFAILGLRSLYFLLRNMVDKFYLLKYGLAIILFFIGLKMMVSHWISIPIFITLGFILCTLVTCVILSMINESVKNR